MKKHTDLNAARSRGHTYPVIGVLNGNPDILESIRTALSESGFNVVTGHIEDLKRGRVDFLTWLEEHDPKVLIYDVGAPFDDNLNFLRLVASSQSMEGRRVLLTTTNLIGLRRAAPDIIAYEILGKPFDLSQLLEAVRFQLEKLAA